LLSLAAGQPMVVIPWRRRPDGRQGRIIGPCSLILGTSRGCSRKAVTESPRTPKGASRACPRIGRRVRHRRQPMGRRRLPHPHRRACPPVLTPPRRAACHHHACPRRRACRRRVLQRQRGVHPLRRRHRARRSDPRLRVLRASRRPRLVRSSPPSRRQRRTRRWKRLRWSRSPTAHPRPRLRSLRSATGPRQRRPPRS